ncbi:MAG TPA: trigger factor [Candidatus Saccharimonadales bacterium]|nr:trigger factor [Candidatus Saccharimonadales bacterium]
MQVTKKNLADTRVKLSITASSAELDRIKQQVVGKLSKDVKLQGFRAGKAPAGLVEKSLEPSRLQSEFLDEAINMLYVEAANQTKIRPVEQPQVEISKFVPFTTLEFTAEMGTVGEVTLPDYKHIKLDKKSVTITAKDINEVIDRLKVREAEKKEVKRVAKDGDEVTIDFIGVDNKTKEPIAGADGKDYPLLLGSNTFIPGFEPEVVGLKTGDKKTFTITFPNDYNVTSLQNRKVSFTVTAKQVNEATEPKVDDAFAAKVGPFKTLTELKADIKKQLTAERERESESAFENELVNMITLKATVSIPKVLVDEQLESMEQEERQNLTYRGQTWQEHLKVEGITEEQHRERNRGQAEQRVKGGLVLSEIADKEGIIVTPEELEIRLQILKGQYQDVKMQGELSKPENRRDIMSRLLTEKTLAKLVSYVGA